MISAAAGAGTSSSVATKDALSLLVTVLHLLDEPLSETVSVKIHEVEHWHAILHLDDRGLSDVAHLLEHLELAEPGGDGREGGAERLEDPAEAVVDRRGEVCESALDVAGLKSA